jgi:hypothetical protein
MRQYLNAPAFRDMPFPNYWSLADLPGLMVCLRYSTPIEPGLLRHFLENDRIAVRVFYAEELEPVWCHFRTLSLQTSVCEFLLCKLYIGATDVKHSILGPLLWRLYRALIRVIFSVQHNLGSPKP